VLCKYLHQQKIFKEEFLYGIFVIHLPSTFSLLAFRALVCKVLGIGPFWGKGTTWRRNSWQKSMQGAHARRKERKTTGRKAVEESARAEEKSMQD